MKDRYDLKSVFGFSKSTSLGLSTPPSVEHWYAKSDFKLPTRATEKATKTTPVAEAKPVASNANMIAAIQAQASKADPLGSTLKFDFGGSQLYIDGSGENNIVSESNEDASCTVTVSKADFGELMKGELNPMTAVMTGKIRIDGDMSVAMKLQSLFG